MKISFDRAGDRRAPASGGAGEPTSFVVRGVIATLRLIMVALFFAVVALPGASAFAQVQNPEQNAVREKLEGQRSIVDGVDSGLGRDGLRSTDLDDLRSRLDAVRTDLDAAVALLEPRLADLQHRLKEIS